MNRLEILAYIRKKKIVLFGAGTIAQDFYQCFHKKLNICYCVSNNKSEKEFYIKGKSVCVVRDVSTFTLQRDEFVIVCASDFVSMQKQLCDMGLCMGREFIDSDIYRILVEDKKVALFYGVCHIRAIKDCLNFSNNFNQKYNMYYFLDYIKYDLYEQSLLYLLLDICDLFIYTFFLSSTLQRRVDTFLKRLNRNCIKISVPLISFHGFYPKIKCKEMENPYCVISNKSPYSSFSINDENMNELIQLKMDIEDIIKRMNDISFYSRDFLIENLHKEFQKIEIAEKFSDISVSDYIKNNYDKERLFLNETHISNSLVLVICKRILNILKMECLINEDEFNRISPLFNSSEVPLYPSVIYHLKLNQYNADTKYKLFTFKGGLMVTFNEYARVYIDFCSHMKCYIEKGFFPE